MTLSSTLTPPVTEMRLVVVGNCQAHPLMLGLERALPRAQIHFCPSVHLATAEDVARLHQRLATADLLVMHRVQPGYRDNIGLDSPKLRSLLPPGARCLVLPSLHYEGHHPWTAYAHDPQGRLAAIRDASPLGDYHDFLAMATAAAGLPASRLLTVSGGAVLSKLLQRLHRESLEELKSREEDCDLALSDWIDAQHRRQPLFHTINHPTQASLQQVLERLFAALAPTLRPQALVPDPVEHLGALSIPLHPWVIEALELEAWASSWGQRQGSRLTLDDQLQASMTYYRDHPWIADDNRHHGKLKLARQCLRLLEQDQRSSAAETKPASTSNASIACLINYYNDIDTLAWQVQSGGLKHYDRIYIWDGPYAFLHRLAIFPDQHERLDQSPLGQRLLSDPRVVYRYGVWRDEAQKRIDAYEAVVEDLVVLHDSDEFFQLDRQRLQTFWASAYNVASRRLQNLYAGGLYGSDPHHATQQLEGLPHKRLVFKRRAISAERHLDYCWLVGVKQNPTNEQWVDPEPLGHSYHLTACRTPRGQAAKMAFYMAQSMRGKPGHPVVQRLDALVQDQSLSLEAAQQIFLRGDPGFCGIPHPDFGLSLHRRISDPDFPETTLQAMLDQRHRLGPGSYTMLEGYPLYLWLEPDAKGVDLSVTGSHRLLLKHWLWPDGQRAEPGPSLELLGSALRLDFAPGPEHHGWLLQVQIQRSEKPQGLVKLNLKLG